MDSGLLNVFHDDPFDGSYVQYKNGEDNFWSASNEALDLQLSETLHGILPIEPAEGYGNDLLKNDFPEDFKDEESTASKNKKALMYNDYIKHCDATDGAIEVLTVNRAANCVAYDDDDTCSNATFRTRTDSSSIGDYESHSSDYDDDEDVMHDVREEDDNDDANEEEDDTTIVDVSAEDGLLMPDHIAFKQQEEAACTSKNRTFSTNTIGSDVDGLGLQIDANNFDLADFITKDDIGVSAVTDAGPVVPAKAHAKKQNAVAELNQPFPDKAAVATSTNAIIAIDSDSDSDSDVIVDVETVEVDAMAMTSAWAALSTAVDVDEVEEDEEDDVSFVDNVKCDPPWSPHHDKKVESSDGKHGRAVKVPLSATPAPAVVHHANGGRNNISLPKKRQGDKLKKKLVCGRKKNATPARCGASKVTLKNKIEAGVKKNCSVPKTELALKTLQGSQKPTVRPKEAIGIGQGGKNLSLIAKERQGISEQSCEETATSIKPETPKQATSQSIPTPSLPQESETQEQKPQPTVKRKLNLEEYKKRRVEMGLHNPQPSVNRVELSKIIKEKTSPTKARPALCPQAQPTIPAINLTPKKARPAQCPQAATTSPAKPLTPTKHSEAITAIVRSLKEQGSQPPQLGTKDPIIEARNKVLRMQQFKRAQQLKIIDSAVTAKVPRVTKLLPLKDIVKGASASCDDNEQIMRSPDKMKTHPDYEEIIIVSSSCNTEISIPPEGLLASAQMEAGHFKGANNVSRSLLKSSVLLANISNSLQKVQATESVRITTNSLISSIQDVVAKKAIPIIKNGANDLSYTEDMVIMHLRKDRARKLTATIATQTELQPEFPLLLPPTHRSREHMRHKSTRKYRKHLDASSDDSDVSNSSRNASCSSSAAHSYRSRSRSTLRDDGTSSTDRIRHSDGPAATSATGGYSTPSSRRHRSSVSSSYSESEHLEERYRRSRRSGYKQRARKYSRSSSTSSMSDYSDRERSRSPHRRRSRSRSRLRGYRHHNSAVQRKEPAVEERRIVYVGRIEEETSKEMLRRKFLSYGSIKQITIHYKETGMKYGFVTYDRSQDAFTVIDNSARDPHINMYDISFGGRRAFCRATYADLDNAGINTYHSYVFPNAPAPPKEDDSFEALLLKVKAKMNANKANSSTTATSNVVASDRM